MLKGFRVDECSSLHKTVVEVIWFRLLMTSCTREAKQALLGHVS
jgi:hypothetical protein